MGAALFTQLDGRQWCATLEIKMNYLLPVTGGTIAAEATVISRTPSASGRRIVARRGESDVIGVE